MAESKAYVAAACLGLLCFWSAASASADDASQSCAESYEKAQVEQAEGKYLAAIEHAGSCAKLECNPAIVAECVKLKERWESEVPTLVFSARKASGGELTEVRVKIDGRQLVERLDGKPIALDPGPHEFRFEAAGFPPTIATHTARVGDRHRLIEVVFGQAPTKAARVPAATKPAKRIPIASYVLGGLGVGALGAFAYLRITAIDEYNELNGSCSPRCNEDDVDRIRNQFRVSYVALGVGVLSLGAAATVYMVSGSETTPTAEVAVLPLPGGTGARFRARF